MKGSFYVAVDDGAKIFVNGKLAYEAPVRNSRSPEMELKVGDRVVVQLRNDTAERYFQMLFASTDGKEVVSFRPRDFRIVPELDVTDYTPEKLAEWRKSAKAERRKDELPVKSYSGWMWGDLDRCTIAGTVTPAMVSAKPQ